MGNGTRLKLIIITLALTCMIFAVKPYYGGEIAIRLNQPADFSFSPSDYSNLVFYSLLYENFFYMLENGEIYSFIFKSWNYDAGKRQAILEIREGLSFSNGDPIDGVRVRDSLRHFLNLKLDNSVQLSRMLKNIEVQGNRILLTLLYDAPGILGVLAAPELVLIPAVEGVFSGMFTPQEWEKDKYLLLTPNPFYPGGRTFVDSVRVVFYDYYYPDIFIGGQSLKEKGFREFQAGIYQNIYLAFPQEGTGDNIRVALYSMLVNFASQADMKPLNSLTSDEESPVTLNIRKFPAPRVRTILRNVTSPLYILSSLKHLETKLTAFLSNDRARIETIYLNESGLNNFITDGSVKYMMLQKVFTKRMTVSEKIRKLVKELSFSRFNEQYLKMLNELEEMEALKNEELMMTQVAKLVEKVINDGFLLPLFQKRYSFYVKERVSGIEMDYHGRPLFRTMQVKRGDNESGAGSPKSR